MNCSRCGIEVLCNEKKGNIAFENDLDFYYYKKHKETLYDQKEKDYTYKGRSIGFMFSNNKKGSNEDN